MRVLILVSPKAGSGEGRHEIPELQQLLQSSRIPCQIVSSPEQLYLKLREHLEPVSTVVVAAGGDGTLSLAATLIWRVQHEENADPTRAPIHLMPMPLGTENLLARQFGFSRSASRVHTTIRDGRPRLIDAGLANGRVFLIMATAGFDADVVRRLHLTRRGHIRQWSYLFPILTSVRRYSFPTLRVHVEGSPAEGDASSPGPCEPIECAWAMVFNLPRYGGGLQIEPEARDDDGLLDVILFRKGSLLSGLRYLTEIWLRRHLGNSSVIRMLATSVRIESESRVPFQLDGDYAGRLPLKVETRPRSVSLLMPPE